MNIVLLFHRLVFAQVLLGIVAFCMAERKPGLLLVAGAIGAVSWYVTQGPSGKTIPRWLVNVGALLAVAWLTLELVAKEAYVVAAMGHFTMALQLLMLYAKKTDREYSQLLVLSLLQMIGASVLSVSMIYGVFLAAYCVLALATVLLFHLTSTADHVHAANVRASAGGPAPARPTTVAGPGTRKHLRWVGAAGGMVCGLVAVAVFVVMPRTGQSSINLTTGGPTAAPTQTGFSNTVRLGAGPIGTGSREPVLNVKLQTASHSIGWKDDPWLIRGAALDAYNTQNYTWYRSHFAQASDRVTELRTLNQQIVKDHQLTQRSAYTAEIALRDARQRTIFTVVAMPTRLGSTGFHLTRFDSDNLRSVAFSPIDQQLQANEAIVGAATYRVTWPITNPHRARPNQAGPTPDAVGMPPGIDELPADLVPTEALFTDRHDFTNRAYRSERSRRYNVVTRDNYARLWETEPARVRNYAQQIIREAGLERDPAARHTPDDVKVAAALADHLRNGYRYDLANPRPPRGQDPTIAFLFESRRGHCELFAAGLAALCRSVGIPARLVTGFRASEFNTLGGYYVVRQSNAHAWTEIDGGPGIGWTTFDATPSSEVEAEHAAPQGPFTLVREIYEHIEFAWIKSIVAFDSRTQKKVLDNVSASAASAKQTGTDQLHSLLDRLKQLPGRFRIDHAELFVMALSAVGLLMAGGILGRLFVLRRRRLAQLQLTTLPAAQRRGLSRRLRFYLTMQHMLERHGYRRPAWQSPSSFARELADANPMKFDPVIALTDLFYEIRFGHRDLDDERKQRIRAHLKQLELSFSQQSA